MVGTRNTGIEPVVEAHVQNWVTNQIDDHLARFRKEITVTIQNAIATTLSGLSMDTLRRNGEGTSRGTQPQFTRMTKIEFPKFGGEDVRGWLYKCEQFFEIDQVSDPHKVQLASIHLYDTASLWHRQFVKLMGENASWNLFKEAILLRFGSAYDAYMKEMIEVENRIVEDVVVETVKELVEVENEVIDDGKVSDDIKVKNRKSGDSEFLVMEDDGFVSDEYISKLFLHKNNGSMVHRQKGLHLLGRYVDMRYLEGWEDEDKDLNVFGYDCEVYDFYTKALLGEKEFSVTKKQEEELDKINKKLSVVNDMNYEGNLGHFKFDIWKWPKRKKIDDTHCKFNHVSFQRIVEEEVCDTPERVPILVGTKGDNEGSSKLILNIFNSDNSFESAYEESRKQGTDGNRSGFKGTFLGYVTGVESYMGVDYLENSVRSTLSVKLLLGSYGYQIYLKTFLFGQVLESFKGMRRTVRLYELYPRNIVNGIEVLLISSTTLVFDPGGVKVFGIWGCEEGMKASDKCFGLSTGGWSKEEVPRIWIEMEKRFPEFSFNSRGQELFEGSGIDTCPIVEVITSQRMGSRLEKVKLQKGGKDLGTYPSSEESVKRTLFASTYSMIAYMEVRAIEDGTTQQG
ncbi:hypothetical protein Tco_0732462 [Tanacetum coccineum]